VTVSYRQFYEGRRVMITGGLGFIGSNLARQLVTLGADVLVVDALIPDYGGNPFNIAGIEDRLRVSHVDIRDRVRMREVVRDQQVIFNLAGQVSHIDSMRDPYADLEINCLSQITLLEACRHFNTGAKVVFAGTRQIYGRPDSLPVSESHLVRPTDVNGINKAAGEYYHLVYNNVFGVRACSLRLTNVYGPGMRIKDARQNFLGIWLRRALEGEPFEVWGGEQRRELLYVEDAVEAFLLAALCPETAGLALNVGGEMPYTLLALAEALVRANGGGGFERREFPDERKKIDIGDFVTDDRRFRELTGWAPRTGLDEGLGRSLEYYRRHRESYV